MMTDSHIMQQNYSILGPGTRLQTREHMIIIEIYQS